MRGLELPRDRNLSGSTTFAESHWKMHVTSQGRRFGGRRQPAHPNVRRRFGARRGVRGVEAGDADEAIRILEARADIHLVFTDVTMPGSMDGIKLAHYIRDRWPPVKLIVASGKTIVEESDLPTGARFFFKPYEHTAIVEAMTRMLPGPFGHADLSL